MITKLGRFKDPLVDQQIDEIVAKQFLKNKEVTVTFTAADTPTRVFIGQKCDKFICVDRASDMRIWKDPDTDGDENNMYFQASVAGTATLMVWNSNR